MPNPITIRSANGTVATGICAYDPHHTRRSKVTIKAGSILTIDLNSVPGRNIQQNYDTAAAALKSGKLKQIGNGTYQVVRDLDELSVSGSAVIVTGKPGSGWKKWRLSDGRLLDALRHEHSKSKV